MKNLIFFIILIVSSFNSFAAEKSSVLYIPDMHCELCPIIIQKSLKKVDGVQEIIIDEENKTAKIIFDNQKTSITYLIKVISDTGYSSSIIE